MANGHVRRVFPGGNTSIGFYSFYEHIVSPRANKIFILKGGPGVGKSSFMKGIAEKLLSLGMDIEYHHCSSDNNSLDGVYVPAIDVALIDGTAPHIVDPKNPGAVDEIIHLGDYWDEKGMRANREPILRLNAEVGRLFRRAYAHLAAAKIFHDEYEVAFQQPGVMDWAGVNRETMALLEDIFGNQPQTGSAPKARHLFATAITPEGPRNYLDTLMADIPRRYVLTGEPGTGKTTIIARVVSEASLRGNDAEVFHCPLDPSRVDHVIIPRLGVAVINGSAPHDFVARPGDTLINLDCFINAEARSRFEDEMADSWRRYEESFARAVWFISRAKRAHDEMETYYVPNMRFDQIARRRDETLERVLRLAEESEVATGC